MIKDFLDNIIKRAEIEDQMNNVHSSLKKLPPIISRTINNWKTKIYDKKIVRCKKFNRRDNWGKNLIVHWFESIQAFLNLNPLIYVHIKSCLEYCIKRGLTKDIEYYQNYHDKGYTYITVEGGNRSDATYLFWQMFPIFRSNRRVNIVIIESVDRATMHEIYVRMAYGNPQNRQEIRTGIYGYLSDKVREVTEKYFSIFNRIKGLKLERMEDDELIAKTYAYTKYESLGDKLDDKLDNDYRSETPSDVKNWLSNMTLMNKFFKEYNKLGETKQLGKGFYYVVLFTLDWMRRKEIKVNKWKTFVKDFTEWFHLMASDDTIYYTKGKHQYSFSDMIRHKATDSVKKSILELCKVEVYSYCPSKVCNEATPRTQKDWYDRVLLFKHHGYRPKLRVNGKINGKWFQNDNMKDSELEETSYREEPLSLLECIDSKIAVIEHVGSLRKNKNADELINQEFSTPEYNSWKSDKI